jgi:hypothetical protein
MVSLNLTMLKKSRKPCPMLSLCNVKVRLPPSSLYFRFSFPEVVSPMLISACLSVSLLSPLPPLTFLPRIGFGERKGVVATVVRARARVCAGGGGLMDDARHSHCLEKTSDAAIDKCETNH